MTSDTLLIVILILLTANLIFVGIYIVLVLKEVRTSIQKINTLLDTTNQITTAVSDPVIGFAGALTGVVQGIKALGFLKKMNLNLGNSVSDSEEE